MCKGAEGRGDRKRPGAGGRRDIEGDRPRWCGRGGGGRENDLIDLGITFNVYSGCHAITIESCRSTDIQPHP